MSAIPWPIDIHRSRATVRGSIASGAIFSTDERHRYALWRAWECVGPWPRLLAVVGLNPSTATHEVSDPTVTRCVKRARAMGFEGLAMLNLFSLRSTDPRGLLADEGWSGGELHDRILEDAAANAGMVIAAWGGPYSPRALGRIVEARADEVVRLLGEYRFHCLGVTKGGHPRHPLYLRSDAEPKPWRLP